MSTRKIPGRILHTLLLGLLLGFLTQQPARAIDFGVSAGGGSMGVGGSVSVGVLPKALNVRAGIGNFTFNDDFEDAGIRYDAELTLGGSYLLADWFPFKSGFRLTAGIFNNNNELSGEANLAEPIQVGPRTYDQEDIGSLEATVGFSSTAPYFGIGYGNAADGEMGLGFSFDLGVMIQGSPDIDLRAEGGTEVDTAEFQDDLAAEEAELEDELDSLVNLELYPVVALGLSFSF